MEIAIIVLALMLIGQAIERYLYSKQMNAELQKCIKAVMSRNINEYISATQADTKTKSPFVEEDEVTLDELGDTDFDKAIGIEQK